MTQKIGTQITRLAQFTGAAMLCGGVCLASYVAMIDRLIPKAPLPATYKAFLLKQAPGPRLIIDSGSNSHHALDAEMISQALGLNTINIADNAGYDIEAKIARLKAYAKPGDTVLLPLEWSYYSRDSLTDDFVDTLFTTSRDYFRDVTMADRIKLALSIPPQDVLSRLGNAPIIEPEPRAMSTAQALYLAAIRAPNGSSAFDAPRALQPGVESHTCDSYAFGKDLAQKPPQISAKIKRALGQLHALKQSGVAVYFAWPVLAGDGCLKSAQEIYAFRTEIENIVQQAGFEFLGNATASTYPLALRDDTPYHLIREGTERHTNYMIQQLMAAGLQRAGTALDMRALATKTIDDLEEAQHNIPLLEPLALNEKIIIGKGTNPMDFAAGWWPEDDFGQLMRGNYATIGLILPEDTPPETQIMLSGLGIGQAQYEVSISHLGAPLLRANFGANAPLMIPTKDLPNGQNLYLRLALDGVGPASSPKDRGENDDERTMTLRIAKAILAVPKVETPIAPPLPAIDDMPTASNTPDLPAANLDPMPINGPILISSPEASNLIQFGAGWWEQEPAGRWMKDKQAEITLNIKQGRTLRLYGDVFEAQSQIVEISFNGKTLPRTTLQAGAPAQFPLADLPNDAPITLTLSLPEANIASPAERGNSTDTRALVAFISAIEILP